MPLSDMDQVEIAALVANAAINNPLVAIAAEHVENRIDLMSVDQRIIASKLKIDSDNNILADVSDRDVVARLHAFVNAETQYINAFDSERKIQGVAFPEQISTHKMLLILKYIKKELTENSADVIGKFVHGGFEPSESFSDKYPLLSTDSYWGNITSVVGTAMLLGSRFTFSKETIADYYQTSIAHATPCANMPLSFVNSGSKFSMRDVSGNTYFGFIHGGYAFGGQRGEPVQYEFGPEDCSSIVAKWLHKATKGRTDYSRVNQFSTSHMLHHWRAMQTGEFTIDRNIYTSAIQNEFTASLPSYSTVENVKAGDIYLMRTFRNSNGNPDLNHVGSGHTGIVIDYVPGDRTKVLTFETSRDMESHNAEAGVFAPAGFGIAMHDASYEKKDEVRTVRTMFLRSSVNIQ